MKIPKTYNTIFLDRDGVINHRPLNDYVKTPGQFRFLPGVPEAMSLLAARFKYIIIVTNQQGIGKNLMTHNDIRLIHEAMLSEIKRNNGRVDAIYYCPDLASTTGSCRKPGIRMAEMARRDFPEIEFKQSVMVGDTGPDMQFGRNAGMTTVLVGKNRPPVKATIIDYHFNSLLTFALSVAAND